MEKTGDNAMKKGQKHCHYTLGLDIGIASIGWAVLGNDEDGTPNRIIDLGVRIFDKAEVENTGESLERPAGMPAAHGADFAGIVTAWSGYVICWCSKGCSPRRK